MSTLPLVSVVTATYNRSQALGHAVESVRRSTLHDWELIVVGDHCTDDTRAVVASFGDPRISFINLPQNVGEQSGPNNEGLRHARGRYVAFLNQDDMYFPDHLASSIAFSEQAGADLVWSPLLVGLPMTEEDLAMGRWRFRLSGVPAEDDYEPRLFVFASSWLLKRELAESVGRWRRARETFVTSSQDWLFRAWRSGARLCFRPGVSVLALPSGARPGSYAAASSPEHEYFAARMRNAPRFREIALEIAAIASEREANRFRFCCSWPDAIRAMLLRPIGAASIRAGVHPKSIYFALRHGRRGNRINHLRRLVGLGSLPSRRS